MNDEKLKRRNIIEKEYKLEEYDSLEKMIEEIEQTAFMAGYDYAIEVLKQGRVKRK